MLETKPEQRRPDNRPGASGEAPGSTAPTNGASSPTVSEGTNPATTEKDTSPVAQSGGPGTRQSGRSPKKEYGSDLVLRNTANVTERDFNDVLDYTLSKNGKTLVFSVSSKEEETNGIYAVTPQSDAAPASLLAGKGKYQKLTWD